jgi:hypothetical protein
VTNRPVSFNDPTGHESGNCYDRGYCTDARDLTIWLVAALTDSAESPEMQRIHTLNQPSIDVGQFGRNKAAAYAEFNYYVKDGAKYDVKDKIEAHLGQTIKLGNNWYEYSTAGNILYGFYGSAAAFTPAELHGGAGKAQLDDYKRDPTSGIGKWTTGLDTADDYAAVKFGIYLYNNYYKKDKKLTEDDLLSALASYKDKDKMALRESPKDFYPKYNNYPVNRFYQMNQ